MDGASALIWAWVDAYPDDIAVMVADPGALLVMLARAYVWPPVIVVEDDTEAMVLFDEDSVTLRPDRGAFAGEPLESCSWTTMAS